MIKVGVREIFMNKNSFSELLDKCDEIIGGQPTEDSVDRLLSLIEDKTLNQYVFQQLYNPEWIMPLFERKVFATPPEPIIDSSDDTISYPSWNEIGFLIRMAEKASEEVSKVILELPSIDNVIIHNQIIRAALSLHPIYSLKVAKKEIKWLEKQKSLFFSPYSIDCGKLISYLSESNYTQTALSLAYNILTVFPDVDDRSRESFFLPKNPLTKIDLWEYEQILVNFIPNVVSAEPILTLDLLCSLLNDSIEINTEEKETTNGIDYSYIWRPDIEHKNHSDIKDLLVSSILNSCKQILELQPDFTANIVNILENYKWKVFLRLSIYLIADSSGNFRDLIETHLVSKDFLNDYSIQNEYKILAKNHFAELSHENKNRLLELIEDGPELSFEDYVGRTQQTFDSDVNKKDYADYVIRWKWEHLEPISKLLSLEWKEKYDSYTRDLNDPEQVQREAIAVRSITEKSPKSIDELKNYDVEELVKYLTEWDASEEFETPTKQGLANTISSLAFSEPKVISKGSMQFKDLELIYINSIISGLGKAVKDKEDICWEDALNLCLFCIESIYSSEENEFQKSKYVDAVKREIASFLQAGYKTTAFEIPEDLRELSWSVLSPLTNDSQPTPDYEKKYGGKNMDPATLSLNTIRGEAMHTIFHYSLWVRGIFEKSEESENLINSGLDMMPEVKEVLTFHLDVSKDLSLAVRSVYGQWYPWLVLIDSKWSEENSIKIFPKQEELVLLYKAAWNSYIQFCAPYDNVFDTIEEIYKFSTNLLDSQEEEILRVPYNSKQRLAEHLMSLYWRGKIEISDDPEQLLKLFYSKASPELLSQAISFIGRTLKNTTDEIPKRFIDRLVELWEYRYETIKNSEDINHHYNELSAFGWWFISDHFDSNWAINQLKSVLEITLVIKPTDLVVEMLASTASDYPLEVIECLRLIITGENDPFEMFVLQDNIYVILQNSINSEDDDIQNITIDIIERLLVEGHFRFRELLPK